MKFGGVVSSEPALKRYGVVTHDDETNLVEFLCSVLWLKSCDRVSARDNICH